MEEFWLFVESEKEKLINILKAAPLEFVSIYEFREVVKIVYKDETKWAIRWENGAVSFIPENKALLYTGNVKLEFRNK